MTDEENQEYCRRFAAMQKQIVVEITEEEMLDPASLEVKRGTPGFPGTFALDDYGSGYSSEKNLLELSPKYIKIDLSIIRGIDTDPDKQQIVANIVATHTRVRCSSSQRDSKRRRKSTRYSSSMSICFRASVSPARLQSRDRCIPMRWMSSTTFITCNDSLYSFWQTILPGAVFLFFHFHIWQNSKSTLFIDTDRPLIFLFHFQAKQRLRILRFYIIQKLTSKTGSPVASRI